jgi:hypothetical protein
MSYRFDFTVVCQAINQVALALGRRVAKEQRPVLLTTGGRLSAKEASGLTVWQSVVLGNRSSTARTAAWLDFVARPALWLARVRGHPTSPITANPPIGPWLTARVSALLKCQHRAFESFCSSSRCEPPLVELPSILPQSG